MFYKKIVEIPIIPLACNQDIHHDNNQDILKNCRGELVIRGKNVHQTNKRNPFGNNERKYDGYIYKIDLDKLKKCKINK